MAKTATALNAALPYADTPAAVYLSKAVDGIANRKNQRQIAQEIGLSSPNMISMIKRGESKLPYDMVPGMARALGVDPSHLMRLALESYFPKMDMAIEEAFPNHIVTKNEMLLIKEWRKLTNNTDPEINRNARKAIKEALTPEFKPVSELALLDHKA